MAIPRVKKIRINKPDEVLVCENIFPVMASYATAMPTGCRIYCGICGECIGETRHAFIFGNFTNDHFARCTDKKQFISTRYELKHKDHSLFAGGDPYRFTGMKEFLYQQRRVSVDIPAIDSMINNIQELTEDGPEE